MKVVTFEQIELLPRWAQVAFAARCASRALPSFQHWSPHILDIQSVQAAIHFAKSSSEGDAAYAVKAINAAANVAANVAAKAANAIAADAAYAASHAAHAAAQAANAADATADADHAADAAYTAYTVDTAIDAMRRDYEKILAAAVSGDWTNDTFVPKDFFGPLESESEENGDFNPQILVEPGTAPPEVIGELLADFSELYRMMGGAGLQFTLRDVKETAEEFVS